MEIFLTLLFAVLLLTGGLGKSPAKGAWVVAGLLAASIIIAAYPPLFWAVLAAVLIIAFQALTNKKTQH